MLRTPYFPTFLKQLFQLGQELRPSLLSSRHRRNFPVRLEALQFLCAMSSQAGIAGKTESGEPQAPPGPPLVVVLGSTATGKSKLAIDLAKHLGGEVVSADSMQVYKGLDILTNKATADEMQGIPHHMISVVDRLEKYDVVKFRDVALLLVQDIFSREKIPIVVGGTNYYIESLLWKVLIDEDKSNTSSTQSDEDSPNNAKRPRRDEAASLHIDMTPPLKFMRDKGGYFEEEDATERWSIEELYQALQTVDPARASKLHPNDKRKVVRSLQVYFRTGRKHSDLIEEQCSSISDEDENDFEKTLTTKLGGPLRFPNTICFWIQADREILNNRINERVDKMVERGIRSELETYIQSFNESGAKWDFQGGQLQSIGVKEFESFIQTPAHERETDTGQKEFQNGVERLKVVTRQYAKRQVQWINRRFLKHSRRQLPAVYGLDGNATDDLSWEQNITSPAIQILEAHIQGNLSSPIVSRKRLESTNLDNEDLIARTCEICNRILLGSVQWQEHMKSAKHWKVVKRLKKLENIKSQSKDFVEHKQSL